MRVEELDYELPPDRVARYPAGRREEARLLVVQDAGERHATVADLPGLLPRGAVLVVNDTRVRAARLQGHKLTTGGAVELLLVRHLGEDRLPPSAEAPAAACQRWRAMVKSSRKLRPGLTVIVGDDLGVFVDRTADRDGLATLLLYPRGDDQLDSLLARHGQVPLPPYLGRAAEPADAERYQTVFARHPGAVAAPTAGLHFSGWLLQRLAERGVVVARVTLHVGPGTFRPVKVADLDDHPMHSEAFTVSADVAAAIDAARARGAPVVAVGTTVVRALESAADRDRPGRVCAASGETDLLIQPGYRFWVVDELLTNLHLPRSTLLALVFAFGGRERVARAYRAAIAERYRFYSYGDAMFIAHPAAPWRERLAP